MSSRPLALITGASRGIGRAIAIELASTHQILATYRGRQDAAESLQQQINADVFRCDISSRADREALVAYTREKYDGLDLLINNAGMAPRERVDMLESTEESFDELIQTNLKGPYFLTQQFANWMREKQKGRIVFITSISAYTASVARADYCLSKAALSMTTALYAQRLAEYGIGVFEIRPGIIRTDMIAAVEQTYEQRVSQGLLPQRRIGEPSDVARAVRAIADGQIDYSTGQVLNVDGGFHLRSL